MISELDAWGYFAFQRLSFCWTAATVLQAVGARLAFLYFYLSFHFRALQPALLSAACHARTAFSCGGRASYPAFRA